MSWRKWKVCVSASAVVLLAACGDSSTQPGRDLTTAQLQSMTSALGTLLGTSLGQPQASRTSLPHLQARWVADFQSTYSSERTCPEQGHLGIVGTSTLDSLGALHIATTDTLVDCGIKDSHGDVWRFTSDPVLITTLDVVPFDLTAVEISQSDAGRVAYTSGPLTGSCSIDVAITSHLAPHSPTPDSVTTSIHTEGMVCGHSVSRDTVITSPWGQS